ncbi:MAG: nuclear transport factor 2 family protein [Pleurocapsa sp. MO_226.B13]|nr:nuclear transport factor 2 family protein [Pleurocapsa sp. MO_226.B13]
MKSALEIVQKWFGSIDENLLAEDIIWKVSKGYPVSQTHYSSRQEVIKKFFPELLAHFSKWGAETEVFIEADNKVVVKGRYVGLIKQSDTPIEVDFIHIWTVRDGVIKEVESVADTAQFAMYDL